MEESGSTSIRRAWVAAIVLFAVTCLLYVPATRGEFLWDDDANVTTNPLLFGEGQLGRIWRGAEGYQYYPLTFTSFWLQRELIDLEPATCHWINVLLHAANGVLLFFLLRRMGLFGAFAAAAIFAAHPVCVESVAWITERKNVLAGLFFLTSAWAYVRFDQVRGKSWYLVALLSFVLAALAKTHAVMLPGILALYVIWQRRDGPALPAGRRLLELLPFFAVSAVLAYVAVQFETAHVLRDSAGADWQRSAPDKVALAGRIVVFYAGKLVFPHPLVFIYEGWDVDAGSLLAWLPMAMILTLAGVFLWKRESFGRHGLFALGVFLVALAPVMGFFSVYFMRYAAVQDHFQYFAVMGGVASVVCASAYGLRRLTGRGAAIGIAALVWVAGASLTWRKQADFQSMEALWTSTIEKNPSAWMALTNLGIQKAHERDFDAALELHQRALVSGSGFAEPHNNLAFAYEALGRLDEAEEHYREATRLEPYDPVAFYNLGNVLFRKNTLEDAIWMYRAAIDRAPDHVAAHSNLGLALSMSGDFEAALQHLGQALALQPDFSNAYTNLMTVLGQYSDMDEATAAMERLVRDTGGENPALLDMLASAYASVERHDEALATARKAVEHSAPDSWIGIQARRRFDVLEGRTP